MVVAGSALLAAAPLGAQGYRVRLDTRFQSVAYRGLVQDSVAVTATTSGPTGGPVTADGYAATCLPGAAYCTYYRPGPELRGQPVVATADFSVWNLGMPGLSIRGTGRLVTDLANPDVWPGTTPTVQLLEGYAEYAANWGAVQGGRITEISRLGYLGFDGGRAHVRVAGGKLAATAYGGWAMARGSVLPVTSPALNPLGEFRPEDRQLVFGGDVGWTLPRIRGRVMYQRQIDPGPNYVTSEQLGADLVVQPSRFVTFSGGADYDLAFGWLGSADGAVAVAIPRTNATVTVGGRRYRPHFDLWTIWGAFSPVPYNLGFGSVTLGLMNKVQVRARGELYRFAEADVATPLVQAERSGWRGSLGATYRRSADLIVTADYHIEDGPGSGDLGIDGSVFWRPLPMLAVRGAVANLQRNLEFRFSDANVWQYSLDVDVRAHEQVRLYGGATYYDENRDRPDAAAFSWNQFRLNAGVRVWFGSDADQTTLPPAVLRIPEGGVR
jgi:hypothetical protein